MANRILVSDLAVGDELLCWMKLGLALGLGRRADGTLYRFVPDKPRRTRIDDLTRFTGFVVGNDSDQKILTVQVTPNNSFSRAYAPRESHVADINYFAFQRIRKFSLVSFEGREHPSNRPTRVAAFGHTDYQPYKTVTEVIL